MALDNIKAEAQNAVSNAIDQAYVQALADKQSAGEPTPDTGETAEPTPVIDVATIEKNAYLQGVVDENRRVMALWEEAMSEERKTEDAFAEKMKLPPPATQESSAEEGAPA